MAAVKLLRRSGRVGVTVATPSCRATRIVSETIASPTIYRLPGRTFISKRHFARYATRTPVDRYGGGLAEVRADDLAAIPLRALKHRNVARGRAARRCGRKYQLIS